MGRPSNAEIAARSAMIPRVIYTPMEDGDPFETVWNRQKFIANIPTELKDAKNGLTAKEMLALAKTNPWFRIEGQDKTAIPVTEPKTSDQYRTYAALWIRDAKTVTGLESRWDAETELRDECGVGTDDIDYLTTLFNPRKSSLIKAEKLAALQVD